MTSHNAPGVGACAVLRSIVLVLAGIALAGCDGSSNGTASAGQTAYTVGGTVSGLTGTGLALQNNGGANVPIAANGAFTFPAAVLAGGAYSVSVFTQPDSPAQSCVVANGSGTAAANVTNVTVTCAPKTATNDTVGGTVTGVLGSGMVLQLSDGSTVTIAANGTFTFPASLSPGTAYAISVVTVPTQPYQDCTVLNGSGTTGDVDISNITISCKTNTNTPYTIGGTVTWQTGGGSLILQVNGLDSTTVTSSGAAAVPFTFSTAIPSGSAYVVTAQESGAPSQSHTCILSNASGVVGNANITNVAVVCGAVAQLAVTSQGLSGQGLTVQDGDGNTYPIAAGSGTASFPTSLTPGQAYNIVVTGQPSNPSQTCTVTNGTGTVPPDGVIPASITCTTNTYLVGGTVTGLPNPLTGNQLILSDNGTDSLTLGGNGAFQFAVPVASNGTYAVTVTTQPGFIIQGGSLTETQYACNVTGAAGTVTNAAINSVVVTCIQPSGFAYVTNAADNTVTDFVIDSNTGALLPFGTVATGTTPAAVTAYTGTWVTSFGAWAYVANSGSSDVTGYSVDSNTGVLTNPSTFAQTGVTGASSVTLGAYDFTNNAFPLYVTNPGSGNMSVAQATGTGGVKFTGTPVAAGAQPVAASFGQDPATGTGFIAAVSATDNTLSAYSSDSTGLVLTPASTFPVGTGVQPTAVAATSLYDPNTQVTTAWVYVATSGDNAISYASASMDPASGLLTIGALRPGVTLPSGTGPITVAVSNFSVYLYAVNSAGVWILSLDVTTGAPTLVSTTPVPVGTAPSSASVFSGGFTNLLYVTNSGDGTVSAFTIDGTTGALTPVTGSPFKTGNAPSSIFVVSRPGLAG